MALICLSQCGASQKEKVWTLPRFTLSQHTGQLNWTLLFFSNPHRPCQLFVPHMCLPPNPVFYSYVKSQLWSLSSFPGLWACLCPHYFGVHPVMVLEPRGTTPQSQVLTWLPFSSVQHRVICTWPWREYSCNRSWQMIQIRSFKFFLIGW